VIPIFDAVYWSHQRRDSQSLRRIIFWIPLNSSLQLGNMVKKKKKPAANPARGFATTSVASKPRADLNATSDIENSDGQSNNRQSANLSRPDQTSDAQSGTNTSHERQLHELTPEELEEQLERNDLQLFVETHGPKVVKNSQRQISKIQTDCRVLRNQSQALYTALWFPEDLVEEILEIARRSPTSIGPDISLNKLTQDDWVNRFWALSKVLMGMGVSKHRVLKLLEALPLSEPTPDNGDVVWGLGESLDILTLDTGLLELPPYDQYKISPETRLETDEPQKSTTVTNANTPVLPRSKQPTPLASGVTTPQIVIEDEEFNVSDIDSDAEPDQLISTYLSTKSRLFKINPLLVTETSAKKKRRLSPALNTVSSSSGVRKLQEKLRRIEADALFDQQVADIKWHMERISISREQEVWGKKVSASNISIKSGGSRSGEEHNNSSPATTEPSSELEDEVMLGDMFSAPDDVVEVKAEDSTSSRSVTLRDFGKIVGLNPRRLLEDVCRARSESISLKNYCSSLFRDSNAKLTFRLISATQFVCRHSVIISWSKSQEKITEDTLMSHIILTQESSSRDRSRIIQMSASMDDIATPDPQQSEAYIATAALFCLSSSSAKEEKAYMKLGQAWRDLWAEFLKTRTEKRDAADRDEVKLLRQIVSDRLEREKNEDVIFSTALRDQNRSRNQSHVEKQDTTQSGESKEYLAFVAQDLWLQRAASPAYQYMLQFRMALPIFAFRQDALATIYDNSVTILCGETGCGKSTQLPAYILEEQLAMGNYCKVLCTEPRRISAISLAQRVGQELGEAPNEVGGPSSLVGYAVRLESKLSAQTRLVYATVGVVLRMLESADGLDDYTHLIIDEVHERSIETDFLLIILRSLQARRPELKVILMSATVNASKFSSYLNNAPIINVPGRTFPVTTLFLEDAIEMTHYAGGRQVAQHDEDDADFDNSGVSGDLQGYSQATRNTLAEYDEYQIDYRLILNVMEMIVTQPEFELFSKAILVFLPGIGEIRELNNLIASHPAFGGNIVIYPLHSTISSEEQQQAFVIPPPGTIKIVLSTNIAETGVTIPDVTCVIDTGKHKEMRFDERRQLSRLVQSFISRANAKQRCGRAGRVQEGICFHLFTKKRHDELMSPQQTPEMLRLSLQDLIMRVKICGLGEAEQALAQALDPPSSRNIRRAIDSLIEVGALTSEEQLTSLGRQLAKLPLDANLGKLCILSAIFGCLDAGLTVASILSSKSPFLVPFGARLQADATRLGFSRGDSDLLTAYNAYCAWRRISEAPNENVFAFCRKNFLSPQVLSNIEELKAQLFSALCDTGVVKSSQSEWMRGRGYGYQKRFLRITGSLDANGGNDILTTSVISWSFYPKVLVREGKGWRSVTNNQTLSLHPTSVNKGSNKIRYLSFYNIMQSGSKFHNATNAFSTSIAHEIPLILLAGEADYKMHAGIVAIDSNRLRFAVKDWKTMLALKIMRQKLEELVEWVIEQSKASVPAELVWYREVFERVSSKFDRDV
jgi:ATP-dependent RNA helicase DHX29